jgi:hypothetical protein
VIRVADVRGWIVAGLAAAAASLACAQVALAKPVQVRECGRMAIPGGAKAWAYTSAHYDCHRARIILHAWLFDGAAADLRGWRCISGTQAGHIVTCRRGDNRVHLQRSGHKGAKVRVD